ncbi:MULTISPECIES: hypothetical protein [unclassified Streptomyces]
MAATRLRAATEKVRQVHVLVDNCCGDSAVRAAQSLSRLLGHR